MNTCTITTTTNELTFYYKEDYPISINSPNRQNI